jgi:tetratricopeptide (TPR) repeat protein
MKGWIVVALIVVALILLAVTAGMWAPWLLEMLTDNPALIQRGGAVMRVVLWLLAALAGAVGVQRALDQSKAETQAEEATRSRKAPINGDGAQPDGNQTKAEWAASVEELVSDGDLVTLYTAGGVRIIAEGSSLEMEEGELRQRPQAESEQERTEAAPRPGVGTPSSALRAGPLATPFDELRAGRFAASVGGAALRARGSSGEELAAGVVEPTPDGVPLPRVVSGAEPRESSRPPVPTPAPVINTPFNLPADLADFVGRSNEADKVRRGLSRNGTVAISGIAGMGGIGKTALALHVAHGLAAEGQFADAQLYIDLKGTEPHPLAPAAALQALLTALQGPDPERPDDEEALSQLWRKALQDKQVLLVLDNAADAAQVKPLLPKSPTCAVLVTSRQRFRLPDSGLLDLNRLKRQEARSLLRQLAPQIKDTEADKIADLCGGLPLALRIAGNYLALNEDLSANEYVTRLTDERARLDYLRDPGNPDLDVVATLSLSVAQLPAGTHWAWSLLSLFPAPFDAASASALWGEGMAQNAWVPLDDETTVAWLETLRNRSLVTYDPDTDRYRLHDLLRLAASRELGASPDMLGARARLLYHYAAWAQSVDERQRYSELDSDWPNVQLILEEARPETEQLSSLVRTLDNYWSARGMARERAEWNEQAAKACRQARRPDLEGIHLGNQGNAYADQGDARQAIEYYSRALSLSRRNGQQRTEGTLLGYLGQAYGALGETRRAVQYHQQALEIAKAVGDRRGEATELDNLGQAYADLGDARQAVEYHTQALEITKELRDRRMEGTLLSNLGLAYAALGELQQAVECQQQALAIHRYIGDLRGKATALDNLGRAYADMGQPQRAIDHFEQALEIDRAIGDRRGEASDLGNLGLAYADLREHESAVEYYEAALKIAEEVGDRRNEGTCLGNLGRAYLELGDLQRAVDCYWKALRIAQQTGDRRGEATWLGNLGQAHAQQGEVEVATDYHQQALSISRTIGDRRNEGNHLANLGMLAQLEGDPDRAREIWTDALRTFEAMKDPAAGQVYDWLAKLEA